MKEFVTKSRHNKLIALGLGGVAAIAFGANLPMPSGAKAGSVEIACSGSKIVTAEKGDTLTGLIQENSKDPTNGETLTGSEAFLAAYAIKDYIHGVMPDSITASSFDTPTHNDTRLPSLDVGESIVLPAECSVVSAQD